uniref:Uncharacterized protein n=1 Tax=Knipowitschia caucasica TaxID=637954 RepID=A0AAV2KCH8_KNICA
MGCGGGVGGCGVFEWLGGEVFVIGCLVVGIEEMEGGWGGGVCLLGGGGEGRSMGCCGSGGVGGKIMGGVGVGGG